MVMVAANNNNNNKRPSCDVRLLRTVAIAVILLLCHVQMKVTRQFASQPARGKSPPGQGGGPSAAPAPDAASTACRPPRDVSRQSTVAVRLPLRDETQRDNSKYDACLQYECARGDRCRDGAAPARYDGDDPPCCLHVLRDMAAAFEAAMCELGLEYFAAYGMLIGLIRQDQLIPWTADNDYVVTEQTLAAMLDLSPEEQAVFADRGLAVFFDNYFYRICITPAFAGGALTRWRRESHEWYPLAHPYADIFFAREQELRDDHNSSLGMHLVDQLGCAHPLTYFRPAQRRGVYGNAFRVSVPARAEEVVARVYGRDWRVPDKQKRPHGDWDFRAKSGFCSEEEWRYPPLDKVSF